MPPHNLTVTSSSTINGKTVFLGVVCTLANKTADDTGADDGYSQPTPDENNADEKLFRIANEAQLQKLLETAGEVCVVKEADKDQAFHILNLAKESDPRIAERVKLSKYLGVDYFIKVTRKPDLIKGSGDGALGIADPEGIDEKSPLYIPAVKNQASLNAIRDVDVKQHATVGKFLSTLGNLVRISPDSPHKKKAAYFKYFLDEVYEVLSHLKRTHAPKALLTCAVTAVFAKYKHECWDAVMRLAADDTAKDLQACADVLLDAQHVNNYLKFMEEVEATPPGPSCREFDAAFGLLNKVDPETANSFRDLIVYLHDTVKPQVESLDKVRALQVNEGVKDGEIESQVNQFNICIRNYLQTFYNIALDFVQIERMSVPDKTAHQQAAMRDRIAGVSRKFWPALESCLKNLCEPTVVEGIESKAQTLTKQLTAASLRASQLVVDAELKVVEKSESYRSRIYSALSSLLGNKDEVKEEDSTKKSDVDNMSPMFSDLLGIMEQLKTYGQVPSASPEESPNVPDNIQPGDHVAICGALGFVSKPLAAAVFTHRRKVESSLKYVNYRNIADEKDLAAIKEFLNVDHHMMKAIQDEGHSFGVHGKQDPEGCDQIMISVFNKYFKECWPHVSAVLAGGDQEGLSDKLKQMAIDILNWKDPGQKLDLKISQTFQKFKRVLSINAFWYLTGMAQFIGPAIAREEGVWQNMTRELWTEAFCPYMFPGVNKIWRAYSNDTPWLLCMRPGDADNLETAIGRALEQTVINFDKSELEEYYERCPPRSFNTNRYRLYFTEDGDADWSPEPHPMEDPLEDLLVPSEEHLWDLSCYRTFESRWYDANDQVMKMLCNEALNETLSRGPLVPNPYLKKSSKTRPLLDPYEFELVTREPGPDFRRGKDGRYLGFLLCTDSVDPTNEEIMAKISSDEGAAQKQMREDRPCSRRHFHYTSADGTKLARFAHSIFYSTVSIDHDGKIFVSNSNHAGRIGNCWRVLQEEIKALGFGKKSRQARDVSHVIQGDVDNVAQGDQVMSREEIMEAFAEAEREGLIKVNEHFGHLGNDTNPFSWTASPRALELSGGAETVTNTSEALMAYWPYVLGVAGSIGAIFSAKKVWESFRVRGKGYRQASQETTSV